MKSKSTPEAGTAEQAAARRRAEEEAAKLARMVELHDREGLGWEEAQKRVGLQMSHASRNRRLKRWREEGVVGLLDRRGPPPSRVTPEIRGFVAGLGEARPEDSTRQIQQGVKARFGVKLAVRTVQELLQQAGVARPVRRFGSTPVPASKPTVELTPREAELAAGQRESLGGAGLALVRVASDLTGCGSEMAEVISRQATEIAEANEPQPVDRRGRNARGQFLPEYNAPRPRSDPEVGAVFRSVEEKRTEKDLTRLSIATSPLRILENKVLALTVLPVVSESGRFDGVTDPRGEWLKSLGIHDYMPETLAKFARELKWAEMSGPLLERYAELWYRELSPSLGEDTSAVVMYVDATTKPYWTEHFHKSGRVSTVGRVMPCLEEVLIHTGAGVPLFMKTYTGHEGLNKNVLPLLHQLEAAIGVGMLGRLTVLDGEGNSVKLFKQFDEDINPETGEIGRYFITPLSHAQVKSPEDIKDLKHFVEYRDGDWLGSGHLELTDSRDKKAPPYRVRVLLLQRRTKGTFSAYATNAPPEEFPDLEAMDTYFHRWPAQEHVFRDLKQALGFESIHGYGKRRVTNVTVVDELTKLEAQIPRIQARLEVARGEQKQTVLAEHQNEVSQRAASRRVESARHQQKMLTKQARKHTAPYRRACEAEAQALHDLEHETLKLERTQHLRATAQAKTNELASRVEQKITRQELLESRKEIYQTDVELDQILSVFKLNCALMIQVLLHRFFNGLVIELNTFIREIVALPGFRVRTPNYELIELTANRRNLKLMAELEQACERINTLRLQRDGRTLLFRLSWPPGTRRHAQ